ncbi:MAG: ABC transporter permease [Erysipelotrichaceae bacterium]|nr:ABC transporter permease [Erysipelotrichaceae bacterium]MDD3924817.1 ABC transporter permease [Erysipelotrichaceae bacterium]MDD4642790.1 ABC transporter permease [Erysipelotrichaceae bacterium]
MIIEYLKLAFADLWANKLRAFLSLIGIVIGVAVVYAIFTIADLTEYAIKSELMSGEGIVTIQYVEDSDDEESNSMRNFAALFGFSVGDTLNYHFNDQDLDDLLMIDGILATYANYSTSASVDFAGNNRNIMIKRYAEGFLDFYSYEVVAGNSLDKYQVDQRISAVVVDKIFVTTNSKYTDQEAIGKTFRINNRIFTIVGVIESDQRSLTGMILMDGIAYDSVFSKGTMTNISVKVDPSKDLDEVSDNATRFLNQRYGTLDNYEVQDLSSIVAQITSVTNVLSTIMAIIAMVSLLVAGIGVMNIMYISVLERTREIGVKRAIGASKSAIQFQFLVESSTLTIIGGVFGIIIGIIIIQIAMSLLDFHMPLNYLYVVYGIIFSLSLGLAFGYLPARKAAKLNIIEAIATE